MKFFIVGLVLISLGLILMLSSGDFWGQGNVEVFALALFWLVIGIIIWIIGLKKWYDSRKKERLNK